MNTSKYAASINNLKRNWYFPISAMAFFCLEAKMTLGYFLGLPLIFSALLVFCAQTPSIPAFVGEASRGLRLFSLLTAAGICLSAQEFSYGDWWGLLWKLDRHGNLPPWMDLDVMKTVLLVVCILAAVVALAAVYFCVLLFWKKLAEIVSRCGVFRELKTAEWIAYAVLLAATLLWMIVAFSRSDAFYGTENYYDVIFTSDSPDLVKRNAYMALLHNENDIRQPLFAVFSAPFVALPYLLGRVFAASAPVRAMLLNAPQLLLLFAANLLLMGMMKLDAPKRLCFMLLTGCTYMTLLFTLMMEQYIVSYFWLILCIYLIVEQGKPHRLALWGMGGTLLTGMILLPAMSEKAPWKDFKGWFMDMLKYGLEFLAVMLAFCRLDTILKLPEKLLLFGGFSGETAAAPNKLWQYTAFVRSIFAAPAAGENTTMKQHISWQLQEPTGICLAGVVILLLVVISAVWNREKKSSRLAAFWVVFSVVMLLGLGWGTQENGLILYSLYFGWAFLVLLWQLAEKLGEVLKLRFLAPVCALGAAAVLAAINLPAIGELLNFAFTHYPL